MGEVVYLSEFKKPKENVTQQIISKSHSDYHSLLSSFSIDSSDPEIAFDAATVLYFMIGLAHRSQHTSHPSHKILDKLRAEVL